MVPRWGKKLPNGFCNFVVTSLTLQSWVSQGLSYASRDQPCETRLLARLESLMVSWEKFAEVVRSRRVSGERHVLYLTSYVRTEQVWSRMSRETRLARRDHGLTVSRSRLASSLARSHSETQLYLTPN